MLTSTKPIDYLIIGYGNTLRSDDGVGQTVATTIDQWQRDSVRSIAVHQLTPDLAAELIDAKTVIFVDAIAAVPNGSTDVLVQPLTPSQTLPYAGHRADPQSILMLAQALYGVTPIAYWVLIPVTHFEFGETLSSLAEANAQQAIEKIKQLMPL